MEKKIELSEDFLKFAEAFIVLSKENHKFSMYILYKYFRSKKTFQKFKLLEYILKQNNTNLYLKEGIKAILLTSWKNFTKNIPGLIKHCLGGNPKLKSDGLHFSGEINRNKTSKTQVENWWKENKPKIF